MPRRTGSKLAAPGLVAVETRDAIDNLAEVWAQVEKLRPVVLPKRPEKSFTQVEYAARYGLNPSTSRDHLSAMLRDKKLTRCLVALPDSQGKIVPTYCYSICV